MVGAGWLGKLEKIDAATDRTQCILCFQTPSSMGNPSIPAITTSFLPIMPSKNDEAGENLKFFICLQRTSENSLIVAITIPLRSIHQFPMLYMDFSHSLEEEQTLK